MRSGRFVAAGAGIAALTSLYYTFAYISRWEWNRAQMAATFTIVALLVAAAIVLDGRLREVRDALVALRESGATTSADRPAPGRPGVPPADHPVTETPAPERDVTGRQDFTWLAVGPERYGVFIPLLLGAGMMASGLAWVVERVAGRTARPRAAARPAAGRHPDRHGARYADRHPARHPALPATLVLPADATFDDARPAVPAGPVPPRGAPAADPADLWLRGPGARP